MSNNNIQIYIKKINYYKRLLNNHNNELYLYKLNKYKTKYNAIGGGKKIIKCSLPCKTSYDNKRTPSNCDRILYKGNIQPILYNVYDESGERNGLIRLSDHLMVYGIFKYNDKNGIVFTWNMGSLHSETNIQCGIDIIIEDFKLKVTNFDYIVFCLQESHSNDKFAEIIVNSINTLNKGYKVSIASSSSRLSNYNVRLIVFDKVYGEVLDNIRNYNNVLLTEENIKVIYLEPRFIKSLGRTKSAVGLTINDITFISCHLPIDTKDKSVYNYLGNNLRLKALEKISDNFSNKPNIIIAGDLNFRKISQNNLDSYNDYVRLYNLDISKESESDSDNVDLIPNKKSRSKISKKSKKTKKPKEELKNIDQLTNIIIYNSFNNFKEFGELNTPTCKLDTCKK